MRIAGIVLLVLAAVIVVPALTYVGYLRVEGALADPAGLKTVLALVVAGLGACMCGIGSAALLASRKGPP